MELNSKIYVAGHKGLVGSAIVRELERQGYHNIITRTHSELDLTDTNLVNEFFDSERPDYVILSAAKVGGIGANSQYPVEFMVDNMKIEMNVIPACNKYNVKKLLFLGSTCIYPRDAEQPIKESSLLTGSLEQTNEAYALAKISGMRLCEYYNREYGTNFISVMPTNLYGYNDNFNLETSHVLPAMIRKMHIAKLVNKGLLDNEYKNYGIYKDKLVLWGSGNPLREFLWSDDLANACVWLLNNINSTDVPQVSSQINIGSGIEYKLSEVADIIKEVVGYDGAIEFDNIHPDGTPRKLCDVSRIHELGWHHTVELKDGIRKLYDWYKLNSYD